MTDGNVRNPRYVAALAAVASLILLVGWFVRPPEISQASSPVTSDLELAQLARRAQRRSLEDMSSYFAGVADEAAESMASVAGGTGLLWEPHRIVAGPVPATAAPVVVRLRSEDRPGAPVLSGDYSPLSEWQLFGEPPDRAPVRRATSALAPGEWMVAVWRTTRGQRFMPATYGETADTVCGGATVREVVSSLPATPAMIGGGLFTLNGELAAVLLPCDGRVAAIVPSGIDVLRRSAAAIDARLASAYGVTIGPIPDLAARYYAEARGLMVRELTIDSPADQAGLWPGDVIVAVADAPTTTMADLQPLLSPGPSRLVVLRGRRRLSLTLGAASPIAPVGSGQDGSVVRVSSPVTGYRIDSLPAGSRAAQSGVLPGDRLLRIDFAVPRVAASVERALEGRSPLLLEVQRSDRRLAILLPGATP